MPETKTAREGTVRVSRTTPRRQEALFVEMVRNENVSDQRNGSNALGVAAILAVARRNEPMRFE